MNFFRFERRANNAVKACFFSVLCVMHYNFRKGFFDKKVVFHCFLVGGSKLGNCDEKRAGAVGSGKAFDCCFHHSAGTCCMKVGHINVKSGKNRHCFFNGVGDIVEFEVEEDFMASCFDFANDGRAFCIEELHTDFYERFFALEFIEELESFFCGRKIAGNNDVFSHFI